VALKEVLQRNASEEIKAEIKRDGELNNDSDANWLTVADNSGARKLMCILPVAATSA